MTRNELIAAMWDSALPPMAKLVFLAILDYRNSKTGDCYPSMESISIKTGVCRNTVAASIKVIEQAGLFTIKKLRPLGSKFTVNSYSFNVQCSPNDQSNEQSVDQSNEQSSDGHKPIEPIKHKEPIKIKEVKKPPTSRGTRFLLDKMPDDWKEYCLKERPDLIPENVFRDFSEHWKSVAGSKGVKLDWKLTWQTWVRRTYATKENTNGNRKQSPLETMRDAWQSVIDDTNQRQQDKLGQLRISEGNAPADTLRIEAESDLF